MSSTRVRIPCASSIKLGVPRVSSIRLGVPCVSSIRLGFPHVSSIRLGVPCFSSTKLNFFYSCAVLPSLFPSICQQYPCWVLSPGIWPYHCPFPQSPPKALSLPGRWQIQDTKSNKKVQRDRGTTQLTPPIVRWYPHLHQALNRVERTPVSCPSIKLPRVLALYGS